MNIVVISKKSLFEQLPVIAVDGSKPQLANEAYPHNMEGQVYAHTHTHGTFN